jgi:hypothetical protein
MRCRQSFICPYATAPTNGTDSRLSTDAREALVTEALVVCNAMAAARTKSGLQFEPLPSPMSPTVAAVHLAVRSRLHDAIEDLDRPGGDTCFGASLPDLLKSCDTVRASDLTTVRPYNPELINVVKAGHSAVDLAPLLAGQPLDLLMDPRRCIRDDHDLSDHVLERRCTPTPPYATARPTAPTAA